MLYISLNLIIKAWLSITCKVVQLAVAWPPISLTCCIPKGLLQWSIILTRVSPEAHICRYLVHYYKGATEVIRSTNQRSDILDSPRHIIPKPNSCKQSDAEESLLHPLSLIPFLKWSGQLQDGWSHLNLYNMKQ